MALYASTRALTRDPRGLGSYLKVELYGVPYLDPAQWWRYRQLRLLGWVRMFEWAATSDLFSRL